MTKSPVRIPDLSAGQLGVTAWSDSVIDELGHDPRSSYVELFWLSTLGPSAVWMLRHFVRHLEATDHAEVAFDADETAHAIGLAAGGRRHSSFARTIERLVRFNVARTVDDRTLGVRRHLPPLTRRQIERLPAALQREHERWSTITRPRNDTVSQERARQLALTLVRLGESADDAAEQLKRWRIGEAAATAAAQWAWRRDLEPSAT